MKLFSKLAATAALVATPSIIALADAPTIPQDQEVTIVGCAVKGNGDGDGFLLANATSSDPIRVLYLAGR